MTTDTELELRPLHDHVGRRERRFSRRITLFCISKSAGLWLLFCGRNVFQDFQGTSLTAGFEAAGQPPSLAQSAGLSRWQRRDGGQSFACPCRCLAHAHVAVLEGKANFDLPDIS